MSEFMLNDQAAIDDINPFVQHDFSLPGGVRQTGNFQDFQEVPTRVGYFRAYGKECFLCYRALRRPERQPCQMDKNASSPT